MTDITKINEVYFKKIANFMTVGVSNVAAFTRRGGGTVSSGVDEYTKLMLHMDDVSLVDSSASDNAVTLNGGASVSSVESKFGGYSAYFDGTGDYLTVPDSADWDFGTGDFTIDCWVKTTDTGEVYLFSRYDGGSYLHFSVYLFLGRPSIIIRNTGATGYEVNLTSPNTVNDGDWHHLAFVRSGDAIRIYEDGIQAAEDSDVSGLDVDFSTSAQVGADGFGDRLYTGYIDELRVSKGISRWTETFTPSNEAYGNIVPSPPQDGHTRLLLHMNDVIDNGTLFVDSSSVEHSITRVGNVVTKLAVKKFGFSSAYFNGVSSMYLQIAQHSTLDFGAGDFTIDCWTRLNTLLGVHGIATTHDSGGTGTGWILQWNPSSGFQLYGNDDGGVHVSSGISGYSQNQWYHVAIVRSANTMYLYINGILKDTDNVTGFSFGFNDGQPLMIGVDMTNHPELSWLDGYLDEFRISKGVARWIGNFTPPDNEYWGG